MLSPEENAIVNDSLGTVVINNKTFLVSQPTRSDIFSFWRYCRNLAKSSYNLKERVAELEGLPDDVRKPLINVLIVEARGEPSQALIWEKMASPNGVAFLLFTLVKNNQNVKFEELEALITINNVDQVLIDTEEACGFRVITENLNLDTKNPPKPE